MAAVQEVLMMSLCIKDKDGGRCWTGWMCHTDTDTLCLFLTLLSSLTPPNCGRTSSSCDHI